MKKTAFVLALLLSVCICLSSCGGKGNSLKANLKDIVTDVTSNYDYTDVVFTYSGTEEADELIYFSYGIDDPSVFEDYVVCTRASGKAASFAIFRFKEGTDVEALKSALYTGYIEAMYSLFQLYIPEEYEIAQKYTFKAYDNALVLVVYDTTGNTGVISTVDKYAE